jgi:hypothetical protein
MEGPEPGQISMCYMFMIPQQNQKCTILATMLFAGAKSTDKYEITRPSCINAHPNPVLEAT